jgi:hypothetical protein
VQQLHQALPLPCLFWYILFDRDGKFGSDVFELLKASGIRPIAPVLEAPGKLLGSSRRRRERVLDVDCLKRSSGSGATIFETMHLSTAERNLGFHITSVN